MVTTSVSMAACRLSSRSRHSTMIIARPSTGWLRRTRFHRLVLRAWSENV